MKAKWRKGKALKPERILEELQKISNVDEGGRVSYDAIEHHGLSAILQSMIVFDDSIVWALRRSSISKALSATIRASRPEKGFFLDELNRELYAARAKRRTKFSLLTTISASGERIHKTIAVENCKIRLIDKPFPKKYREREDQEKRYRQLGEPTPRGYQRVIVSGEAPHPHEAVHLCLRSLDIYRALLCLFTNLMMELSFGTPKMPINRIVLGNMHSLHLRNGKLNDENQYWFEPYPENPKAHVYPANKVKIIRNNINWMLAAIGQSKYGDRLKGALLRYVRALDERDPDTAILKMWGALESLSMQSDDNYDALVRRCSFVVADTEFHRQQLEGLRAIRNSNVHAGEYSEEARTYCYQMQFYFYCLFIFHIQNCQYFTSLSEAMSFLDLSHNREDLKRKKALVEKAIAFRAAG